MKYAQTSFSNFFFQAKMLTNRVPIIATLKLIAWAPR
jgi:hypothetical protein